MIRLVLRAAVVLGTAGIAAPLAAQSADTAAVPGADLRVSLITIGPGTHVWERFGHNAIRITDTRTGADTTYNYGMFDFGAENFFTNFAGGRMEYWMEGHDASREIGSYMRDDRSVWEQVLELTPAKRLALRDFLQRNALPGNRFYRYDYYRDNCSTRVRDALDGVLGGALRAASESLPSGTTYRWHTRRLTENDPFIYTGINIGLGRPTDREITRWEEMFLPLSLMEQVRGIRVANASGALRPLVRSEETLYLSTAEPPPAAPPAWWPRYLAGGILTGLLLLITGARRRASGALAATFGIVGGLWGLLAGVGGIVLTGLWLATDHRTSYMNENLLQLSPLSLGLAVLVPLVAFRRRDASGGRKLALAVLALSGIGLLLKLAPGSQVNFEVIAMAFPIHLGLAAGLLARAPLDRR